MPGAAADILLSQRLAVQEDLARIRGLKTADELGEGGFARAVPAHDAHHLPLADREADIPQGLLALLITKAQALYLQQRLPFRLRGGPGPGREPVPELLGVGIVQHKAVHMGGVLVRSDIHPGIAQSRDIQRLPDAVFRQQTAREQLVRAQVCQNGAVVHQHDAVHVPPKHILQPMLDDEHCGVRLFLDLVDQLNGLLAGSGVEVGQRLIEEQDLDLIHHHARQAHPLLLPARKLVRCVAEMVLDAHQLGGMAGDGVHLILRGAAVFQCKGNVLAHGQPDELAVRVPQHRAHMGRKLKEAAVRRIHTVYGQGAGARAGVGKRVQAVDAPRQRTLAAAGGARNEHPFTRVDLQIDIGQGGALLGAVLEGKVAE